MKRDNFPEEQRLANSSLHEIVIVWSSLGLTDAEPPPYQRGHALQRCTSPLAFLLLCPELLRQ
eukprot:4833079-Prymnesium_polylepis.2